MGALCPVEGSHLPSETYTSEAKRQVISPYYAMRLAHGKFPQAKGRKRKRSQEPSGLPSTVKRRRTRARTSIGPCLDCKDSPHRLFQSSQEGDVSEVSDFKINYVERYDLGARIGNDHLGPYSLEASCIEFCDSCLVLYVRVRRWPGQDREFEISTGTRVRIVNARLFVGPNAKECDSIFSVIYPMKMYGVRYLALKTEVETQEHDEVGDEEDWETEEESEDYMKNVNPCDNEIQVFSQTPRSSKPLQLHVGRGETKFHLSKFSIEGV